VVWSEYLISSSWNPINKREDPAVMSQKIAVIGAGWSGLLALKTFIADGHTVECFEKSEQLGGVWVYRESTPGGVFRSTIPTSSKCYLHASDYPLPSELPYYPHHSEILTYLQSYARNFELEKHIRTNHTVMRARKKSNPSGWELLVQCGSEGKLEKFYFDAIAVCTGQLSTKIDPTDEEIYQGFTGQKLHSSSYKFPTEEMQGQRILIVGGGESASDIATELCTWAKDAYLRYP